jgi:predicted transcriptional regulator
MISMYTIEQIEHFCTQSGISPAELLKEANVHPTQWGRWKSGQFEPRLSSIRSVSNIIDTKKTEAA